MNCGRINSSALRRPTASDGKEDIFAEIFEGTHWALRTLIEAVEALEMLEELSRRSPGCSFEKGWYSPTWKSTHESITSTWKAVERKERSPDDDDNKIEYVPRVSKVGAGMTDEA